MVVFLSVIRSKQWPILLALAVVWVWAWGSWAVWLDTRYSGGDSTYNEALALAFQLGDLELVGITSWISDLAFHPPLPYILAGLFIWLFGDGLAIVRLSSVLLHGLAVWQVHGLTRAAGGDRGAAAWASLLCALTPTIFGWFRLDFQEPLTTVLLLATLRLALNARPERPLHAAGLGLLLGLGVLCKLSFALFGLAPALAFLALRLRSLRAAGGVLLAVGVALASCGWWVWQAYDQVLLNLSMSTNMKGRAGVAFDVYLGKSPGNILLYLLCAAGLLWAGWQLKRKNTNKTSSYSFDGLLIIGSAWAVGTLLLLFVFDPWGRYALPLSVLSCVPAGWAVRQLSLSVGRKMGQRAFVGVSLVCAGLLLARALSVNLAPSPSLRDDFRTSGLPNFNWPNEDRRVLIHGMVTPDTHRYDAMARARRAAQARGVTALMVVLDPADYLCCWKNDYGMQPATPDEPGPALLEPEAAEAALERGSPIHVLHVIYPGTVKRARTIWELDEQRPYALLRGSCRQQLALLKDDSPFKVALYKVWRCPPAEQARQPLPGSPPGP